MKSDNDSRITLLLRLLDQAYDHKAWHGTNLRGSLRGVSAEVAAWRPGPGRHSIWELAIHSAYWKYTVLRRIIGAPRGSFPRKGSDWFKPAVELTEAAWKKDLLLLRDTHRDLRAAIEKIPAKDLDQIPPGSETLLVDLLLGVASHDLYHAGQIQLVKRLRQTAV